MYLVFWPSCTILYFSCYLHGWRAKKTTLRRVIIKTVSFANISLLSLECIASPGKICVSGREIWTRVEVQRQHSINSQEKCVTLVNARQHHATNLAVGASFFKVFFSVCALPLQAHTLSLFRQNKLACCMLWNTWMKATVTVTMTVFFTICRSEMSII